MPLFRRALWPHDHRDELVAGALVGAVVVVLGYASGIGAPSASSTPSAAPPAATTPLSPAEPAPTDAPPDGSGSAAGTGVLPVTGGGAGVFYPGGTGEDHTGHSGDTGHTGHGTSPVPSGSVPSPSPSDPATTPPPTDDAGTCDDGEVRLVRPLLTDVTEPVFGLLTPTGDSTGTPEPQPSPCVGLAPLSSLLGGTTALSPSPSPSPEATP